MTSNRQITFTYIPVVIIALLFVTPFVVSDKLYDGPIIAKEFWFLGVVALIILYTAIRLLIRKEKIKIRLDLPDILLLAFFIWGLINAIFITPYTPFFYNHKLQLLSGCVVVYFFIKSVIRYEINENDEENGKSVGSKNNSFFFSLFIFLFIISGLLQAVYGLLQLYGVCSSNHYLFKTTGSFYHPAPYALYLAVVFPMAMGVVIKNGKFITTHVQRNDNKIGSFIRQLYQFLVLNSSFLIYYLAVTTFIAILLVLPATMIRAAWVGAFVGSVVVLWYAIRRGIINKPNWIKNMLATTTKRVILIGLGIVLLGLASIFLYKVKEGSSEGRTFIWKVTKEKMAEKPFNGVGLGRFKAEYNIWQANWFASGNGTKREEMLAGNVVFAYNEFLEITVELGIIGLLLFFSFAFSPLMNIENYSGNNKSGSSLNYYFHKFLFLIGLITLLTSSLFSYPFYSLPTFILLFVFIALLSQRKKDIYSVSIKRLIKYLIVFFLIVSVVLFSIYQYSIYKASRIWNVAEAAYFFNDYKTSRKLYEMSYSNLSHNGYFLSNYGKCLEMCHDYSKAQKTLEQACHLYPDPFLYNSLGNCYKAQKEYSNAEKAYEYSCNMMPSLFYPKYLLLKLYDEEGKGQKVIEVANKLLVFPEKTKSKVIDEMKTEAKKLIEKYN